LLLPSTLATGKGSKRGSGQQNGSHTSLVLRPGGNRVKHYRRSLKSPLSSCVSAEKLRATYCVRNFGVPEPTEWQRIGDEIKAAMIFTRADFINVL
jgi:hypothetical protein